MFCKVSVAVSKFHPLGMLIWSYAIVWDEILRITNEYDLPTETLYFFLYNLWPLSWRSGIWEIVALRFWRFNNPSLITLTVPLFGVVGKGCLWLYFELRANLLGFVWTGHGCPLVLSSPRRDTMKISSPFSCDLFISIHFLFILSFSCHGVEIGRLALLFSLAGDLRAHASRWGSGRRIMSGERSAEVFFCTIKIFHDVQLSKVCGFFELTLFL